MEDDIRFKEACEKIKQETEVMRKENEAGMDLLIMAARSSELALVIKALLDLGFGFSEVKKMAEKINEQRRDKHGDTGNGTDTAQRI